MSTPNISTAVSFPSIPSSASSNSNFAETIKVKKTSIAVKEIALAIIFGILAVAGTILLATGTAASFGLLPFALIAAGTLISAVISGLAMNTVFKMNAAAGKVIDAVELDGESLVAEEPPIEEALPKIKLTEIASSEFTSEDPADFFKDVEPGYPNGIHPRFIKDCVRDRLKVRVDGHSLCEKFPEESAKVSELAQQHSALIDRDNEIGEGADRSEEEVIQEKLDACRDDLTEKMIGEFTRVVAEKLGRNSLLLPSISYALCQFARSKLQRKMDEFSEVKYGGRLDSPQTEPVPVSYTSALEFPNDPSIAAKITIEASGKYKHIIMNGEARRRELTSTCNYEGTAFITFFHDGRVEIKNSIDLIPAD